MKQREKVQLQNVVIQSGHFNSIFQKTAGLAGSSHETVTEVGRKQGGCESLQASEGRGQASDLLLICLDTAQILCLPASTASQAALQIRMGVGFGTLEPLEIWLNTWDLMKSHYSQGKKNNIVKVFLKTIQSCIFVRKLMMISRCGLGL